MNLDLQILRALRQASSGISGADLAARLEVTRAAVWARVEELRRLGYDIEATPHSGYRLVGTPDALHADDLMARMGEGALVGRRVQVYESTASTNDLVERLGRDGAEEGVVVFAEAQTRGRGRLGRVWSSPSRQGLWFSVLLRPAIRPEAVTRLIVMAAVALRKGVERFAGVLPGIKWPNDLLIGGRKFAGILTEMSAEPDRVRYVVVGIGVDVNQGEVELAGMRGFATSLRLETGRMWDRAGLAVSILGELDRNYARLEAGRFGELAEEWEAGCITLGQAVSVRVGGRVCCGRAESLDPEGALLVRTEHGHLERVTGGDLTMER
ncbi:MAG: biotin--[acetyl-CoA-carboxylase] ligase [Limisphaerales bacterium]|jgi:BirA family biotin operon repressor/biotin-[acetyl-CoA-carboxylase] ligase